MQKSALVLVAAVSCNAQRVIQYPPSPINNNSEPSETIFWGNAGFQSVLIWGLLSAFLVFMMQAGLALRVSGHVRGKGVGSTIWSSVLALGVGVLMYWAIGWGFSFGGDAFPHKSRNAFIGSCEFGLASCGDFPVQLYPKFFFHLSLVLLANTLALSGAAERVHPLGAIIFTVFWTGFILPVPVHWTWSSVGWISHFTDDSEWNQFGKNGMLDFGGAFIHMAAGFASLVGTILAGPRQGRFPPKGIKESAQQRNSRIFAWAPHNKAAAGAGVLLLVFGWFGANAGNVAFFPSPAGALLSGKIVVITILGAAGGGIAGFLFSAALSGFKHMDFDIGLTSVLVGMVSVTGGCALFEPWAGLVVGAVGAILCSLIVVILRVVKLDDPLNIFAVHGIGGWWSLVAVGLWTTEGNLARAFNVSPIEEYGAFYGGGMEQLGVQLASSLVIFCWAAVLSGLVFGILKGAKLIGVASHVQAIGLDRALHSAAPHEMYTVVDELIEDHAHNAFRSNWFSSFKPPAPQQLSPGGGYFPQQAPIFVPALPTTPAYAATPTHYIAGDNFML